MDHTPAIPAPRHAPDPGARHSRAACLVAATVLLGLLAIPGLFHLAYGLRGSDLRRWGSWLREKPTADALREIDADFDRRFLLSFAARALTADVPDFVPKAIGTRVLRGNNGFLFTEEDTTLCSAAGFLNPRFPRPALAADQLIDLDRQLKLRGIHLLVLPVPAKASIYPDRLYALYDPANGPMTNVDNAAWFAKLRDAGVDAIDLSDLFWAHRRDPQGLLYYPTDTHWTDYAKRAAAGAVAERLRPILAGVPRAAPFHTRVVGQNVCGNLLLIDNVRVRTPEVIEKVVQLLDDDGPVIAGDDAPVLVIGDSTAESWSNYGYGFPQRVTEATGVAVQCGAVGGSNGDSGRQVLVKRPGLLRAKRVVIFCFSLRHITLHDWHSITLPPPQ